MSFTLYKARANGNGSACNINVKAEDECLYVQISKQTGWDEAKKLGAFKGGKRLVCKFSITEIGAIMDAIQRNIDFSTVHKTSSGMTQIKFTRYIKDEKQLGYGLSLGKKEGDNTVWYMIGISYPESKVLLEYLRYSLNQIFTYQSLANKQERDNKAALSREKESSEKSETECDPGKLESEESNESEPIQEESII